MPAKVPKRPKRSGASKAASRTVFQEPPRGKPEVSVIIPVADGDLEWLSLALDLTIAPPSWEILFCGPEPLTRLEQQSLAYLRHYTDVRWIPSDRSRAGKLNLGAERADGKALWFVHADSRVDHHCFAALEAALPAMADTVVFFRLAFLGDGPPLTKINQFGAWFRSEILRIPFGDQGLCLPKALWRQLGGFPEDVPYGEDHLLVWRAHQAGAAVRPLAAKLYSSARKYRDQGWRETTARHLAITYRQALPELSKLLRKLLRQLVKGRLAEWRRRLGLTQPTASTPQPPRLGASAAHSPRPEPSTDPQPPPPAKGRDSR